MYGFALWAAVVIQRLHVSSSCGGTFRGSGIIQSPNFPAEYGNNLNCQWTLFASSSHDTIRLDLIAFETESCCDYLSIVHSNGSILHRFHGTRASSVIVRTNGVSLMFITDGSVTNSGFAMRFTSTVTADFYAFRLNVNTSCNMVSVRLDESRQYSFTMNPTNVVYSIKSTQSGWSATQRIVFAPSRTSSINFLVNSSTMYSVWATPETCVSSTSCSTDESRGFSQVSTCVYGRETMLTTIITSAVQYEIIKEKNWISVKALPDECQKNQTTMNFSERRLHLTCVRKRDNTNYTIEAWPHQLDPRCNYTCILSISYADSSREASRAPFDIATADFSRFHLSVNTTCEYLSAKLNEWLDNRWDVEPSFVLFSIQASGSGELITRRIGYDSVNETVTFLVDPNTTYTVWAAPETCWPRIVCTGRLTEKCFNPSNCFTGGKTAITRVTTMPLEYELNIENGIIVAMNKFPNKCQPPRRIMSSCKIFQDNSCGNNKSTHEDQNYSGKIRKHYQCNLEVLLINGRTLHTTHSFRYEEETMKWEFSLTTAVIAGGSTCFLLLVALITTCAIMRRRINALSLPNNSTNKSNVHTGSLQMAARHENEEERDDDLYVNINTAYNAPHDDQSCSNENFTGKLKSKGNVYTT